LVVYKITNKENGKIYIGQTRYSAEHRFKNHLRCVDKSLRYGHNIGFYGDLKRYGKESFIYEEIDFADNREEICKKEKYWIKHYESRNPNKGYNRDSGGQYGLKCEETKKLIGEKKRKNWKNKHLQKRMSDGLHKATEKWVEKCKENRVEFVCPVCGSRELLKPHDAMQRTYCSTKCFGIGNLDKNLTALMSANEANAQKIQKRGFAIKEFVLNWALDNEDIILNTAYNKTNVVMDVLCKETNKLFGIKDARVIALYAAGMTGRKNLLRYLKEHIRKYMLNQSESTEVSA
jgi:predicted RNA-binding Zn-ribbon protein involved in translation (DUF1610 family)